MRPLHRSRGWATLPPPRAAQRWKGESVFEDVITTHEDLRAVVRPPSRLAAEKVIDHIDPYCRRFIEAAPFVVIASRNPSGFLDLSPKGDPAGFVAILDERTLALPDRLGNNRLDTFSNVLDDPNVALIFTVPGREETLRIGGKALVVRDAGLRRRLAHGGKEPNLVLVVRVERAFFHCGKCMIRSKLWEPASWADPAALPSLGEAIRAHGRLSEPLAAVEAAIEESAARLY
jgi:uncharacterized protein